MKQLPLILTLLFILAVVGLTDPTGALMPSSSQMTFLALTILLYAVIIGFIFKSKPKDERESFILDRSSRLAFLAGTLTLIVGIAYQTFSHSLDNWLVYALSLMLVTKLITMYRLN